MSTAFQISSDGVTYNSTFAPTQVQHVPPVEAGVLLSSRPLRQGLPSLQVTFQVLSYSEMVTLMGFWQETPGFASYLYLKIRDERDASKLAIYTAVMHQPDASNRLAEWFENVTVLFTHLRLQSFEAS